MAVLAQGPIKFGLSLSYKRDFYIQDGEYDFDGSLLEVMAQLSGMFDYPLAWLLDQINTATDISLLLAVINTHHTCSHDRSNAWDTCVLQKILDRGADSNATQYSITPLQIAAATRDVEGVRELMVAGADANATGNRNGICFKDDFILSWCNELQNLSPLYICRNFESSAGPCDKREDREEMEKRIELGSLIVEALLL
jgi:hypothetical protein